MFDILNKYQHKGNFLFRHNDNLSQVCNAPKDSSGVYLIYALEKGKIDLIYIGISGRKDKNGNIKHRKDGLRGRFLTGKQFGDRRQITWPIQMQLENIEALDIYWYVTHGNNDKDFPRDIERDMLKFFFDLRGNLPRWNKEF